MSFIFTKDDDTYSQETVRGDYLSPFEFKWNFLEQRIMYNNLGKHYERRSNRPMKRRLMIIRRQKRTRDETRLREDRGVSGTKSTGIPN